MKKPDWKSLIARQAGSGLSVADFCRGEGVGYGSFLYWRKKLAGSDLLLERPEAAFTEVVLPEMNLRMVLHFPGGVRLELEGPVDAGWLRQLVVGHV